MHSGVIGINSGKTIRNEQIGRKPNVKVTYKVMKDLWIGGLK